MVSTSAENTQTLQAATPSSRYHLSVKAHRVPGDEEILSPQALDLVRALHRTFGKRRHQLLDARWRRSVGRDTLGFLPETAEVRTSDWSVPAPAPGLVNRQVEISAPVDPASAMAALNSGADVWMADFEDAASPTWANIVTGHLTIRDAVQGTLRYPGDNGVEQTLGEHRPTIVVRPRGLHLLERHIKVDTEPVPAGFVDFALHCFHNAETLVAAGSGPYFYLPKLENHLEARLWNDVFDFTEDMLQLPRNTIRATVLIETITAAFEMEEILYELRGHAAGLTAGRWDYIFSIIKHLGHDADFVVPDRSDITFAAPLMKAYQDLLVHTAHKRGAYAIGGKVEMIPGGAAGADNVVELVREDKVREAMDGFEGSWVAHPSLVSTCREAFQSVMGSRTNQLDVLREDVSIEAEDLLDIAGVPGSVTLEGVTANMTALVRYLDAWLDGRGAIAVGGRVEDTSTAEIARAQLWQWMRHGVEMEGGETVTRQLLDTVLDQELKSLARSRPGVPTSRLDALSHLVHFGTFGASLPPSVTEHAYRRYLLDA